MKRFVWITLAIVVLAAAGWSALWFGGKGRIETRLEQEVLRLEQRGYAVTRDTLAIGGFPFGYRVRADNLAVVEKANGTLVRFPHLEAEVDAGQADRLTLTLPETFSVTVPIPEAERAGPDQPTSRMLTARTEAMRVVIQGQPETGRRIGLLATRLDLDADNPEATGHLGLGGLDIELTQPPPAVREPARLKLIATEVAIRAAQPGDGVAPPSLTELGYHDVTLTATSDLPDLATFASMLLSGSPGVVDGAWQMGASTGRVEIGEDGAPDAARISVRSASGSGLFNFTDGIAEIRSANRIASYSLETSDPANPIAGSVGMDTVEVIARLPLAPSDILQEMSLRLALIDVTGDETLWKTFDPEGKLDRAPARLVLDIAATGRLLYPLNEAQARLGAPYEIGNISIDTAELAALGAEATASGDVEIVPPINLPLGTVKVSLKRPGPVLEQLAAAGLISPEDKTVGYAILQAYTRAGDDPNERVADVEYGPEGVTVNGLPIR